MHVPRQFPMPRPLIVLGALIGLLGLAMSLWAPVGSAQVSPWGGSVDERSDTPFTPEGVVERQLEQLPLESLDAFVRSLDYDTRSLLPPLDLRALIFEGEGIAWETLGRRMLYAFTAEVAVNIHLLGQLIILGVFGAVLRNVATSLGGAQAGEVAVWLCLLILLLISLHAFHTSVNLATSTVARMVDFMHAVLPVLSTLLAAAGAVTTAAIFHPLLFVTVTVIAMVVQGVLLPLVLVLAALSVLGSLSQEFPLKQLGGLLRQGSGIVIGLCFLGFFAVMQARGAIAPVADGLALRTAKFLTGSFVPVVGGRIADALDIIIGGSVLIKNAVGVFGMGAIAAMTAFPIVKIFTILLVFRVACAVVEPITDPRLVQAMGGLASSLTLLLAGMLTAALMFFVALTVVISVGNTAAMMN